MRAPPIAALARRALLPLPLIAVLPTLPTFAADQFDYVENGKTLQLTEMQARDKLTEKVRFAGRHV